MELPRLWVRPVVQGSVFYLSIPAPVALMQEHLVSWVDKLDSLADSMNGKVLD